MKPTNPPFPHERPSNPISQIANSSGIGHPCSASSSTGHPNLHYEAHPNFRQYWKQCNSASPEHRKFSETSLKGLEDSQHPPCFSFPPFNFSQETNKKASGFGFVQYPISADNYQVPEFKPNSSFVNHTSFRPTQNIIPIGPFSDISIPDYQQSIPGNESHELKDAPRSDPTPGSSQDDYSDGPKDGMHPSVLALAQPVSSQAEYPQDKKKPLKRRITEKRREQNRAHQKAFRLRRDLLLKNKDLEINALEKHLNQYKVENTQQREAIINLKAQVRASEYMRLGKISPLSVRTTSSGLLGECQHSDESLPLVETMDIHERPKFFPSDKFTTSKKGSFQLGKNQSNQTVVEGSSAAEPACKSLERGLSTNHQSQESFFPWASTGPVYVPAQNSFDPNTQEG